MCLEFQDAVWRINYSDDLIPAKSATGARDNGVLVGDQVYSFRIVCLSIGIIDLFV